ncbi:MAG: J domain-containing protein [bacterium]
MEKVNFNPENEIPQDLKRFYSQDPYEVLGVPSNATSEEIKQAYRKVQRKFHPDVSKDPRAGEISQNINVAYSVLTNRGGDLGVSSSQSANPFWSEKPNPTPPVEHIDLIVAERKNYYYGKYLNGKRIETIEDEILWELREGFLQFRSFLEGRSKQWNIKEEQIKEVIKSERGQQITKDMFMSEFWNYLSKLSASGGENYLRTVEQWAGLGVDISDFINLPEVVKELESHSQIQMKYKTKEFNAYVQSWMKAGWKPSVEIMSALEKA